MVGQAYLGANPGYLNGYYLNKQSNPSLKWERSETSDVGLDMSVLNDRLTFTVNYF